MLTKRERVIRTVNFQETDYTPIYDIFQNDGLIEHYAGEPITPENGYRVKGIVIGKTLDMTRMPDGPSAPREELDGNGFLMRYERWTSWIIQRPFDSETGMVEFVKCDTEKFNRIQFDSAYRQRFHAWLDQCNAYSAAGDPTGRGDPTVLINESGVGLDGIFHLLGWEFFTTLMVDYPEVLDAYLEARHQVELRRVAAIADPKILPIVLTYDDIAYKTSTLISPKWLRKNWVPRLKRLVDAWHTRDTLCVYHSDGNLWPILDDLVSVGIDGLNPLEVLAGMTVKEVRQKYPHLFLTGGIDVSQLLSFGTVEEVREVCRQTIQDAGGLGYFIGSSTELHWGVKPENAIAMFETAWGK